MTDIYYNVIIGFLQGIGFWLSLIFSFFSLFLSFSLSPFLPPSLPSSSFFFLMLY